MPDEIKPRQDIAGEPCSSKLELSPRQRKLAEALGDRSARLQNMYVGVLHVLAQEENPDRHALASHGMRELIEKLPRDLAAVVEETLGSPFKPNHEMHNLGHRIKKAREKSTCFTAPDEWGGEIDGHLREFLESAQVFYERLRNLATSRQERTSKLFTLLDPMGRPLPPGVADANTKKWNDANDFFQRASHHGTTVTEDELQEKMQDVEDLLLSRMLPIACSF